MSKWGKVLLSATIFIIGAYMILSALFILILNARVSFLEEQLSVSCSKEDVDALMEEIGFLKESIWILIKDMRESQTQASRFFIQPEAQQQTSARDPIGGPGAFKLCR